jgi:hypothetical protein
VSRDGIHQSRRETIVRLQAEFLQPGPHRAHVIGARTGLNDGRYKSRELGRRPAPDLDRPG